jgi:chitosanase
MQGRLLSASPLSSRTGGVLELSENEKRICRQVLNAWETSSVDGRYDAIAIFDDGPNGIRQITYGRSQTTEYGKLKKLIAMYVETGSEYSDEFQPYLSKIGKTPLVNDSHFIGLLREAARNDQRMRNVQDTFFDEEYMNPSFEWAGRHGFTHALSGLVIYDSFVHSGSILPFLRKRFPERPPSNGGDEKTWIRQYVDVRHDWLRSHSNPDLVSSSYRTKDLKREISSANWDLSRLPIMANGVPVSGVSGTYRTARVLSPTIPSPPSSLASINFAMDSEEWSELEPRVAFTGLAVSLGRMRGGARESRAELAERILTHPGIELATVHVSGVNDDATALQNIIDTSEGRQANRSSYGTAPGGSILLDVDMLSGLLSLAEEYTFSVSEFCGGSHSATSRHYRGVVADINYINGIHVEASHPSQMEFRQKCAQLGATQVLGPGDPNHSRHIHAGWPI